jgi:hypothetical protein
MVVASTIKCQFTGHMFQFHGSKPPHFRCFKREHHHAPAFLALGINKIQGCLPTFFSVIAPKDSYPVFPG